MMRFASSTWLEIRVVFCLMREAPSAFLATASPTICDFCTKEVIVRSVKLSLPHGENQRFASN